MLSEVALVFDSDATGRAFNYEQEERALKVKRRLAILESDRGVMLLGGLF